MKEKRTKKESIKKETEQKGQQKGRIDSVFSRARRFLVGVAALTVHSQQGI